MIYTLTVNPALDLEYRVKTIRMGTIHRSEPARADWGGKGFNVSRVLRVLGEDSIAVGLAAGFTGQRLQAGLQAQGIPCDLVWVQGETRTNVSILGEDPDEYLKVNDPGPQIGAEAVHALIDRIRRLSRPNDLWVMSGSLPPGAPSDFYAQAVETARAGGSEVFLDTSGEPLRLGCAACPAMIKPNLEEAAELTGRPLVTRNEAVGAAEDLRTTGLGVVVISMGGDGVVAADRTGTWFCPPLAVKPLNPVGAGDALVAGLAAAHVRGWDLQRALRLGTACGSSAVSNPGTGIGAREEIEHLYERAAAIKAIDI